MLETSQRTETSHNNTNYYEIFNTIDNEITTTNTNNATNELNQHREQSESTIRISSVNPCGLSVATFEQAIMQSLRWNVDIQCFSETNLNSSNFFVRQNIGRTLQKIDNKAKAVWSSSELESSTSFQPGGTAMVVFGDTASRVKQKGSDKMGRWCYMKLEAKDESDLLIISIYQSCNTTTDGNNTFSLQQKVLLQKAGD